MSTQLGICTTCGAPLLWAPSAKTGKPMPLDREPHPGGSVRLTRGDRGAVNFLDWRPAESAPDEDLYPERYRPHGCPQAREHRRRERAA